MQGSDHAHRHPRRDRAGRDRLWARGWPRSATRSCWARARATGPWRRGTRSWRAWPDRDLPIDAGDNTDAAEADLVVIATPWDSAATTAHEHAADLEGKVVVSMANALVRVGDEFQPLVPPRGSVAAHVQAAVPNCRVVAAFHHLPAKELGPPRPARSTPTSSSAPTTPTPSRSCPRSSPPSPAAGRSTPASSRTPRPSRPSPPSCCSSTSATGPGWRRSSPGIKA